MNVGLKFDRNKSSKGKKSTHKKHRPHTRKDSTSEESKGYLTESSGEVNSI